MKAALRIAYPNNEGLGEWEPAKMIAEDSYDFTDLSTDQTDVTIYVMYLVFRP